MSTCNFFVRRFFLFFVMSSFAISQQSLYGMDRESDDIECSHSASHHLSAVSIDGDNVEEFLKSTSNQESLARVQSLTLTGSWEGKGKDNIFHALLLPLKGLRTLNVEISSLSEHDAIILSVLMPRDLKELTLNSPEFPKSFFEYVPQQLNTFNVVYLPRMNQIPYGSFGSLKELTLTFDNEPRFVSELDYFFENPPQNLRLLCIKRFDWSFDDQLTEFLSKFKDTLPSLTHLIIDGVPEEHAFYESDRIKTLGKHCKNLPPSLEYLEFSNALPPSDYSLALASKTRPSLDVLHLTNLRELHLDGWILSPDFDITSQNAITLSTAPSNHPLIRGILQGKKLSQKEISSLPLGQLGNISYYIVKNTGEHLYHGETLQHMAKALRDGSPDNKDLRDVLVLYELASKLGFPTAHEVLGKICLELSKIEIDKKILVTSYLRKAVQYGNKEARYELALMYRNGEVERSYNDEDKRTDEEIALDLFLPLAEEGNSKAQHNVGNLYFKLKDYKNAKKWFQKSDLEASKRNLEKIINLGH